LTHGEREADFIACVAWRTLAEQVGQFGARGRLVGVQGRLQTRTYESSEGGRRRLTEVVTSQVKFLDHPKRGQEQDAPAKQPEQPQDQAEDAVPF
jgi:single-strand DNA-binding protein